MLNILRTPQDVLDWLYAVGEGHGLPKGAIEFAEAYVTFRRLDTPSGESVFEMSTADGKLLKREVTPHFAYAMPLVGGHYQPTLEDITPEFALPAVAYAHFEEGFDRAGDFKVAFFDIRPLDTLERPRRFSARTRMASVLDHLDATSARMTPEQFQELVDWYNQASEDDVRTRLSEHFGQDLTTDEALRPWLTSFKGEFKFFFAFIRRLTWADLLEEMEACKAAKPV